MARRSTQWYLHKVNRICGYVLFAIIPVMVVSGLATAGRWGVGNVISHETGWAIHNALRWPIISFFVIHASFSWYFSFRRWRWIR